MLHSGELVDRDGYARLRLLAEKRGLPHPHAYQLESRRLPNRRQQLLRATYQAPGRVSHAHSSQWACSLRVVKGSRKFSRLVRCVETKYYKNKVTNKRQKSAFLSAIRSVDDEIQMTQPEFLGDVEIEAPRGKKSK